jgi:pilus assembly protein Flp/PilA
MRAVDVLFPARRWAMFMTACGTRHASDRGATAVEYGLVVALLAVVVITAVTLVGTRVAGMLSGGGSALGAAGTTTQAGDLIGNAGLTTKYTTIQLQTMLGTDPSYSRFWVMDVSAAAGSGIAVPGTKPDGTRDYSSISYTAPTTPGQYAITLKYNAAPGPPLGNPPVNQPGIGYTRTVIIDVR